MKQAYYGLNYAALEELEHERNHPLSKEDLEEIDRFFQSLEDEENEEEKPK